MQRRRRQASLSFAPLPRQLDLSKQLLQQPKREFEVGEDLRIRQQTTVVNEAELREVYERLFQPYETEVPREATTRTARALGNPTITRPPRVTSGGSEAAHEVLRAAVNECVATSEWLELLVIARQARRWYDAWRVNPETAHRPWWLLQVTSGGGIAEQVNLTEEAPRPMDLTADGGDAAVVKRRKLLDEKLEKVFEWSERRMDRPRDRLREAIRRRKPSSEELLYDRPGSPGFEAIFLRAGTVYDAVFAQSGYREDGGPTGLRGPGETLVTKGAYRVELEGFDGFGKGTWEVGPSRSSGSGSYDAWPIDGGEMLLARDLDELYNSFYVESVYLGPPSGLTQNIADDALLGGVFECEGRSFTVQADDLVCIWSSRGREPQQFIIFRRRGATTGGAVPAAVKPELDAPPFPFLPSATPAVPSADEAKALLDQWLTMDRFAKFDRGGLTFGVMNASEPSLADLPHGNALEYLEALVNEASDLYDRDISACARLLANHVFSRIGALLGPDHPLNARACNTFGLALRDGGRRAEALAVFEYATAHAASWWSDAIMALQNRAATLYDLERNDEAGTLLREALLAVHHFDRDAPMQTTIAGNLAAHAFQAGDWAESESYFKVALPQHKWFAADASIDELQVARNIALLHQKKGDLDAAATLYRSIIGRLEARGERSPGSLVESVLAMVVSDLQMCEAARQA